jgi:sugar phosphate isomerase/epimerase
MISMFKYAVNTNSLPAGMPPTDVVKLAKDVGLNGIEWGLPKLDKAEKAIRDMVQATSDGGLEVAGFINGGKMWKPQEIRQWAELVGAVGGGSLRVAHPWIAWDYNEAIHQPRSFHELFAMVKDSLPHLMELGKAHGIRFVLELHSGALTASPLAASRLMQGSDPRYIGAIYDPANTIIEGNLRPRSEVEVLGPYLAYVHAKNVACVFNGEFHERPVRRAKWEYKTCPPAYGIVDYLEVMFALKLASYHGWISFEEFFRGDDRADRLKDSLAFLKECEQKAPSESQQPFTSFND